MHKLPRLSLSLGIMLIVSLMLLVVSMNAYGEAPSPAMPFLPAQETPVVNLPLPAAAGAPDFDGGPLPEEEGDWFATAGLCTNCHTAMVDQAGNDVSTDSQWRATMMANSARDPYWQASVRSEALAHPALQSVIEEKCATCHMPLALETARETGETTAVLDDGFLNPDNPLHTFAMDGISCTLCHQIEPDGFGDKASFSGQYTIDFERPIDERPVYGPFEVSEQSISLMRRYSGYVPAQGLHIQQSEQCATCHMLYTPYVDANGEVAGEFPEQTPYLEWLNSGYAQTQSCQDCHMPLVEGPVPLTNSSEPLREPVHQHTFSGGNSTTLAMVRVKGEELGVTASSAQFDAAIAEMVTQMQTQAASLALEDVELDDDMLEAEIVVSTLVGHKFPTSFPSRRAWLHITVQDGAGNVIFESGAFDETGRIQGNDGDADPAAFEPHYTTISSPDQVQIYEAIMGTTDGDVTTTLLRGATYLKDNRIPPAGFDATAEPDIAVVGGAAEDPDFVGGGDTVALSLETGEATGPFTITVDLLYQSISYRWAENLRGYEGPELTQFFAFYDDVPNLPIVVAQTTAEVGS